MLDGVGDVRRLPVDAGLVHHLVQQPTGWPDEGLAGPVFLVARLLADEHHGRALRTFAEYRLRGVAVDRATVTRITRRRQPGKRPRLRHERFGRPGHLASATVE